MPSTQPLRRRLLSIALLATLPVAPARSAPEPQRDGERAPAGQLETVVVTAQRREENVIAVPVAVTTVEPETLAAWGGAGDDIRFLSGRLPSLNIESSFGRTFPRFYIRGLGNADFDLNASQPVSLVYDDLVLENPMLKGFPVFDLDRVEMLRGPQGTLFGRNTPAGVVKFESRKPGDPANGHLRANVGRFGTLNLEGAAGDTFREGWSARAAFLYQTRDDWVDNTFTGQKDALEGYEELAARVQVRYEGAGLDALFGLQGRDLEGTARLFRANIIRPGSNEFVAGFDPRRIAIDGGNGQDLKSWGASARLRFDLGSVALNSITGWQRLSFFGRGDIDGGFGASFAPPFGPGFIPFPAETADGIPEHAQVTQEFRLESKDWGAFDWQAGFFWFDEDLEIDSLSYDTLARGRVNGFARQNQRNKAWAVYASGEYETGPWTLRGGLRYTDDEKEFSARRFSSPIGGRPLGPLTANPSATDLSWDLSTTYALSTEANLYARVAKGFRAPSIQGRILFGDALSVADSEEVISFEAGYKADLFDRRARVGLAAYTYRVDDQQLTAVGGTTNFNRLLNADRTNGRGVELDLEAYLTPQLLLTVATSYNHTEIDDPRLAVAGCGAPCTVRDPRGSLPGTFRIDGNPLPQAPEWIANVSARWGTPVGAGEFFVYTDWAYRSEVDFFLYESAEFRGDALLEGGLRIGYQWGGATATYEAALFGRNITNDIELVGGIDFNNLTGFVNEPRVWGFEFSLRY